MIFALEIHLQNKKVDLEQFVNMFVCLFAFFWLDSRVMSTVFNLIRL